MRIKVNGEMVYSETFRDWTTLEEDYTRRLTLEGKPVQKYSIEAWMVSIALFVVGQVIAFVKDAARARKEKRQYEEFLKRIEQQVNRIVTSKCDVDPEQLHGRALLELLNFGEVSIELETDVERDLFSALKKAIEENGVTH